jgi:hypothetical protein
VRNSASLPLRVRRSLQLGRERRQVDMDGGGRRPGRRFAATLLEAVGRPRLPRRNALVSALDQEVPRARRGGAMGARAASAHFATGSR